MSILRTGVDMIEIERVAASIERHGDRFLCRVYTDNEVSVCNGRTQSLAARFAAKEAVAKALGTGIWREGIGWTDIEVGRDLETGAPVLRSARRSPSPGRQTRPDHVVDQPEP